MALKILKKIGVYLFVLIGLSILVFVIARVIPGDVARQALGPHASEETVELLREKMHLNEPLPVQYILWLKDAVQLDLGESVQTRRPVIEDIKAYLPATLEIVLLSAVCLVIGGIVLGVISMKFTGKWVDLLIRILSYLGICSPAFVWGVLLMLLFGYVWPILPTTGRINISLAPPATVTGMFTVDYLLQGDIAGFWDAFKHLIIPAIALMLGGMAQAARLTRGNMAENAMKDYIQAEKAYGVPENRILTKYLLRPSLIPTITVMAMDISSIFGNGFLVENLFNFPGLARYGLGAMLNKDINAISGVVMVLGIIFILLNLLSDIIVAWLDPRVRLMGGSN